MPSWFSSGAYLPASKFAGGAPAYLKESSSASPTKRTHASKQCACDRLDIWGINRERECPSKEVRCEAGSNPVILTGALANRRDDTASENDAVAVSHDQFVDKECAFLTARFCAIYARNALAGTVRFPLARALREGF